jgi:hypothetical protein
MLLPATAFLGSGGEYTHNQAAASRLGPLAPASSGSPERWGGQGSYGQGSAETSCTGGAAVPLMLT